MCCFASHAAGHNHCSVDMKVVSDDVSDWDDEWQALHLFSAFAFRKVQDLGGDGSDGGAGGEDEAAAETDGSEPEQKPFDASHIIKL